MSDGGGRQVRATRNSVKRNVGIIGTVNSSMLSMCERRLTDTIARQQRVKMGNTASRRSERAAAWPLSVFECTKVQSKTESAIS